MSDEKIRYAYRVCPCFSYDVEGIQTWLEDMAAQGLVLEADGIFLGIFTFQKTTPQKHQYRLAPIQEKKGFFSDSTDGPDEEEQEFSKKCGWEYLVRYQKFYIYRATGEDVRPLHTDPAVHAMALGAVKKQQRGAIISTLLNFMIYALISHELFSIFRSGTIIGLAFLMSLIGYGFWLIGSSIAAIIRLSRYQKRLRSGDDLDRPKNWKENAVFVRCVKLLPILCILVFLISWMNSLFMVYDSIPLTEYPQDPPFAVLEDIFPEAEIDRSDNFLDYNTVIHYATALSENYEWRQEATVFTDSGSYHCILRIEHHETAGKLWAKGLFQDYYTHERLRYRGKRYEALEAPVTGFDDVKVYSSYGILHVLIRQGSTVTHATVSITQQGQNNRWHLWLDAMESKLLN